MSLPYLVKKSTYCIKLNIISIDMLSKPATDLIGSRLILNRTPNFQSHDEASEDVPKKEKEGDDKTPNDKETCNATSDKGSAESSNEEATEDSKRTDDSPGKEKDDEKDDGGGATAETTPDHSDDEGNDEGGGEDDNDGDDEADEDNRKRSLQDPDSPGGGSARLDFDTTTLQS